MPTVAFSQPIFAHRSNICCPRDVSLSDSKCLNGGHEWVKKTTHQLLPVCLINQLYAIIMKKNHIQNWKYHNLSNVLKSNQFCEVYLFDKHYFNEKKCFTTRKPHCRHTYSKTKKSSSLHYFDTCFMPNISEDSNRRWHDSLSIVCMNKESCHRLSETPPILYIKHLSK